MSDGNHSQRTTEAQGALDALAPVLRVLADAVAASPEEIARQLADALPAALGWVADLAHSEAAAIPPPGPDGYTLSQGVAFVPFAPGWTLRIAARSRTEAAEIVPSAR